MPRGRRARPGAKRPSNPLAAARDRAPTGFSASARDGPGREHTHNNHSGAICAKRKEEAPRRIPRTIEVFERKLHPRPLGQGYTCLGATPDAAPPPPCCPPPPAGTSARRVGGSAPPLAPRGLGRPEAPGSEEDPCRAVASADRGLARIGTPGQVGEHPLSLSISISGGEETYKDSPKAPSSDGPGASPMEWGAREGDSPVVPDPVAPRGAVGEVGLFGNAAQIGREADGAGRCAGRRARDGESRSAADSGADRRWSRATQARRMIPPAIRRLCDRGGWRYDHGRVPSGHLRAFWRRASSPFIRLETRTKESDMCAKPAGDQTRKAQGS
ncbi:hypothetical protein H6P81_021376 [Aristolochia fimbriata]|uniref:Uncharacterized protein n=1 Tax=Aristolochia fimbriata TaxID=158543 RepID=A0AAV7DTT6_ARIFI|nr:hypothetical protein H6P81_021376 [Aristolochia fimbriata]